MAQTKSNHNNLKKCQIVLSFDLMNGNKPNLWYLKDPSFVPPHLLNLSCFFEIEKKNRIIYLFFIVPFSIICVGNEIYSQHTQEYTPQSN
jgi:hypothetical protein